MKIKVSEASGRVLDWLVAKVLGHGTYISAWAEEPRIYLMGEFGAKPERWQPSTDWSQGGPIIGREHIDILHCQNSSTNYETLAQIRECADITGKLIAQAWARKDDGPERDLIAAMRCFVASRLGDETEVPEELL